MRVWKRIGRCWIVGLAGLCLLLTAFLYGFASSSRRLPPYETVVSIYRTVRWSAPVRALERRLQESSGRERGRWRARPQSRDQDRVPERVEQLASLSYASGVRPAPRRQGVTIHHPARSHNGLNLVLSGHAPEATIMDMAGAVKHRWSYRFFDAFPDAQVSPSVEEIQFWRRARVLEGGDLLVIFEGHGLIRLDRSSGLRWSSPVRAHHDLDLSPDGEIYVLTREIELVPRINRHRAVIEDFITVLDGDDGAVLRSTSLLEAFERSEYAPLLSAMKPDGDIFHTNTLELLDGSLAERSPAFRRGNVLISVRDLNAIAVVDLEIEQVVWALSGMWLAQHQPTVLDNGNLLLFDNLGHDGRSRVLELDPFSQQVHWSYDGVPSSSLFTLTIGSCQRLPNGNTLITESEAGRAVEVTTDGEVVWEYLSPGRVGSEQELIATLFEVVRLDQASVDWLDEHG